MQEQRRRQVRGAEENVADTDGAEPQRTLLRVRERRLHVACAVKRRIPPEVRVPVPKISVARTAAKPVSWRGNSVRAGTWRLWGSASLGSSIGQGGGTVTGGGCCWPMASHPWAPRGLLLAYGQPSVGASVSDLWTSGCARRHAPPAAAKRCARRGSAVPRWGADA